MAQRRRNPTIARREICMFLYAYVCVYIYVWFFPLGYIYMFIHVLTQQSECMPEFHLWSRHIPICEPFTLKRSMYDYKLYVSLLIFVYSLMDSDERASLQKKMFWTSNRSLCMLRKWWMLSFYMCHLCMFQYMLQWTCLACTWCITRCDVKKTLKCRLNIWSVQHLLSRKWWVGGSSQNCGCIV